MNIIFHKELADGKWFQMTLAEQLGNIGSEVSRAARQQGKNDELFRGATERALELFDLTLADVRWRGRLSEIARAREVFCDAAFNGAKEYRAPLKELLRYFDQFALAARLPH